MPWVVLGVAALIDTSWVAHRGLQAMTRTGAGDQALPVLAHQSAQLLAVPFVVMALLRLPHPPTDRRRTQTIVDTCTAVLGFAVVYGQAVLPLSLPAGLPLGQQGLAIAQAGCAVVVSTTCIHVLARARQPGGLPFASLGPVAVGVLAHVLGLALLQLVLVAGASLPAALPGFVLAAGGQLLVADGAWQRRYGPEAPRRSPAPRDRGRSRPGPAAGAGRARGVRGPGEPPPGRPRGPGALRRPARGPPRRRDPHQDRVVGGHPHPRGPRGRAHPRPRHPREVVPRPGLERVRRGHRARPVGRHPLPDAVGPSRARPRPGTARGHRLSAGCCPPPRTPPSRVPSPRLPTHRPARRPPTSPSGTATAATSRP